MNRRDLPARAASRGWLTFALAHRRQTTFLQNTVCGGYARLAKDCFMTTWAVSDAAAQRRQRHANGGDAWNTFVGFRFQGGVDER